MRLAVPYLFLLRLMVILLPFHSVFIDGYFGTYIFNISYWKELAVIFVIALLVLRIRKVRFTRGAGHMLLAIGAFSFLLVAHIFLSPSAGAMNGARLYLVPLLLLACLVGLPLKEKEAVALKMVYLWTGVSCAIFAIFQVLVLGDEFLLAAGFDHSIWDDKKLKFSFYIQDGEVQRAVGGFAGPILFSMYMLVSIFLCLQAIDQGYKVRLMTIFLVIFGLALLMSMVRSALLALLIVYIANAHMFKFTRRLALLSVGVSFFVLFILNSDWARQSGLYDTVLSFIEISTGGEDSSRVGHYVSYLYGLSLFSEYWLYGYGLGTIGPQSGLYFPENIVIESSYLSILVELGIIGFLAYGAIFYFSYSLTPRRSATRYFLACWLLVGIVLPLQYYLELQLLLMLAVGLDHKSRAEA